MHKSCLQGKERDQSHFLGPVSLSPPFPPSSLTLVSETFKIGSSTYPCCYLSAPTPHIPAGIEISNPNPEFLNTREQIILLEPSQENRKNHLIFGRMCSPFCCKAHTLCKHFFFYCLTFYKTNFTFQL